MVEQRSVAISLVTWGEVREGLIAAPPADISQFEAFSRSMQLLGIDQETALRYGMIRAELRRIGQLIADNDLWIAATALRHDLTLMSRDRHFEKVPGLMLYVEAG
jgi:tRNA(fMet)-specific endonuclease VapC